MACESYQSAFSDFTCANFNSVFNTGDEDNSIAGSACMAAFSYYLDKLRGVGVGTNKL